MHNMKLLIYILPYAAFVTLVLALWLCIDPCNHNLLGL